MRDKLLLLAFCFGVFSCSEENLPIGIYDYQVERLLSGQTGTQTWSQTGNFADCADSVKLMFILVENSVGDSLDISIIKGCSASSNAILIGRANASSAEDRNIFTDSLIFASGDFWIVNQITSQQFNFSIDDQSANYLADE